MEEREVEMSRRLEALQEGGDANKQVEALKATQVELLKQLADLKGEGEWDYEREKLKVPTTTRHRHAFNSHASATTSPSHPLHLTTTTSPLLLLQVPALEKQNTALEARVDELQEKLAKAERGGGGDERRG